MKRFGIWCASLTAAALALGCESSSDLSTTPDFVESDPFGEWHLVSFELDAGGSVKVPEPKRYALSLSPDGRARIQADCNLCSGELVTAGSRLSFGPLACTLAACQPGSLDTDFVAALGSVSEFSRGGALLALNYDEGVLRFEMP